MWDSVIQQSVQSEIKLLFIELPLCNIDRYCSRTVGVAMLPLLIRSLHMGNRFQFDLTDQ